MQHERSLAHIEEIKELQELPGYDRVVLATVLGWRCIVAKDDFKVGDRCIYIEIDSLVPGDDERFSFMEKRGYRVKTLKMCKTISQGLVVPLSSFPEISDVEVGTDVTEKLRITYYNPEDRKRKSNNSDDKYKSMISRHKKLFKRKSVKWLMKRPWGKKLLFAIFGKKKDKKGGFPHFVKKTDEERCENMPWILNSKTTWSVTEKIDGTSTTFAVEKKRRGYDFIVCSRNVRQKDREQECWHDSNVYWEMADKYSIQQKLEKFAKDEGATTLYLQGETYGSKVQGNPYKLNERRFAAFNLCIDGRRVDNSELFEWCDVMCIPHVPLIDDGCKLPDNMDGLKSDAEGMSVITPTVKREGLVYRDEADTNISFKNVSLSYLLKKGE